MKRHNGKCKACGMGHTALLAPAKNIRLADGWHAAWLSEQGVTVPSGRNGLPVVTCTCGKVIALRPVKGTFNAEKECNAKCLAGTGHVCECKCGGKNHGAGHYTH